MLRYGDISVVNNGNSKSLVPRNLTYRQKELFKTKVSDTDILSAIQLNSFDIPNAGNISSDNADFNTTNVTDLYVDLIRKKTVAEPQITINDKLLISDRTDDGIETFQYSFTNNGYFDADTFDFNVPSVKFQDNVIYLNSKFIDKSTDPLFDKTKYDSMVSGFIFPQINDQTENKKKFNGMFFVPSNYYLYKNTSTDEIQFVKYTNNDGIDQLIFPDNDNQQKQKQSLRLIRLNYPFDNNSTFDNQMKIATDDNIAGLNDAENLLNLEVDNIAMYNGNFVLLKRESFDPNDGDIRQDNLANFTFWASDLSGRKQLFTIRADGVNVFGPLEIDENIVVNRYGIKFGIILDEISIYDNSDNKFIIFNKTNNKTSIVTTLDLSANGLIYFNDTNKIIFNNGSQNVLILNSTDIDTSANLNLLNGSPKISFDSSNELIIKDTSNYLGFFNNEINVYQPLNLSPNGIIKFDSNLYIKDGTQNIVTIKSTNIDTSANINLLNDSPNISFRNGKNFTITNDNSVDFLSIDSSNYVNFYGNRNFFTDEENAGRLRIGSAWGKPGIYSQDTGKDLAIGSESKKIWIGDPVFKENLLIDLSYNPKIIFKDNIELIIKDSSNYLGFYNNEINVYQPLDLSCNGNIKFGSSLNFKDGSQNVVTINSTDIDSSANLNLLNGNPEITFTTGEELIIKDTSNYLGFYNNEINVYQPLDLSCNGNIKFGSSLNFKYGSNNVISINSTDIDSSANLNLLNGNPEITFTTNDELIIKDSSNYLGFYNNEINVYQPLDLSCNGNIKFGSSLNLKYGSNNVISINSTDIDSSANLNLLNGTPEITFDSKLNFINNDTTDTSSNAIIIYSLGNTKYEKKYLHKVQTDTSTNIILKDIIDNSKNTLTFTGKISSYYAQTANIRKSANFLFDGYSRDTGSGSSVINTVYFNLNTLYSDDTNWTINSIDLSGTDLVLNIQGWPIVTTKTQWIISVESVSI